MWPSAGLSYPVLNVLLAYPDGLYLPPFLWVLRCQTPRAVFTTTIISDGIYRPRLLFNK